MTINEYILIVIAVVDFDWSSFIASDFPDLERSLDLFLRRRMDDVYICRTV